MFLKFAVEFEKKNPLDISGLEGIMPENSSGFDLKQITCRFRKFVELSTMLKFGAAPGELYSMQFFAFYFD